MRRFRFRGSSGKVNFALSGLPTFSCLPPGTTDHYRGMVSISPSIDYLERAYDDAVDGRFSRAPYVDMGFPIVHRPVGRAAGQARHGLLRPVRPVRAGRRNLGRRSARRSATRSSTTIAHYAPDLPGLVLGRQVLTPLDIERTFGLTEGNIFQGELLLEQLFAARPLPGSATGRRSRAVAVRLVGASGRRDLAARRAATRRWRCCAGERASGVSYDAIVVGGGHNGLVCAAYLARGGHVRAAARGTRRAGWHGPSRGQRRMALAGGRRRSSVSRAHGLELIEPQVAVFAPRAGGRALTLWSDAQRTAGELGGADAPRYLRADRRAAGDGCRAGSGARRGTTVDARVPRRMAESEALRTLPMAVRDLVEGWFEPDALRAAVAWRGLLYTGLGPRAPGTAGLLLRDAALGGSGVGARVAYARGGPRALVGALSAALAESSAEVRTGARVVRVRQAGGRVVGVTLADGEQIDARVVVSTLDPQSTLLDLLEPEAVGPRLGWRATNIRQAGVGAFVRIELRDVPRFSGMDGDVERLRGRIVIAPSMRYLELAARPARHATAADEPLLVATMPALVDPSLPLEMHVVAQPVGEREPNAIAEVVIALLEHYAPGFAQLVASSEAVTPAELARAFGVRGGHAMHAEMAFDQWFEWRPHARAGPLPHAAAGLLPRWIGRSSGRWRDRRSRPPCCCGRRGGPGVSGRIVLPQRPAARGSRWLLRLSAAWVIVFGLITIVGAVGYVLLERWSLGDGLYMTVITLTTTGFREVQELDSAGRLWTGILSIVGVVLIFGTVGIVAESFMAEAVSGRRERRRMADAVHELEGHYILCGYGRVGSTAARELEHTDVAFVVVDINQASLEQAAADGRLVVAGDATRDEVLETAGIRRARGLITTTDSDANNVYITLSARALNSKLFIISRANDQESEGKLRQAGADRVVSPYTRAGRQIAEVATRPRVADFLDYALSHGELSFSIEELEVVEGGPLVGLSVGALIDQGVHPLAIAQGPQEYETNPGRDRELVAGDHLIASGTADALGRLRAES